MTLYGLIEYFKSNKKKLYCCFIDFTKAFDNIWRAGLWQKLLKHGIRGKILTIIQNMYKEIKSCITVNGNSSGFFSCEKGVRHGENLSPLLFAIYLNDLETYVDLYNCKDVETGIHDENVLIFLKLFVILYADDTIILSDDAKHFQDMLNVFSEYCKKWKLKINIEKTKVVIFDNYIRIRNVTFFIDGQSIEIVKEFKYLGALFTNKMVDLYNILKVCQMLHVKQCICWEKELLIFIYLLIANWNSLIRRSHRYYCMEVKSQASKIYMH